MAPCSDSSSTISSLSALLAALRPGSDSGQAARRPRARESSAAELGFPRLVVFAVLGSGGGVAVFTYDSLKFFSSERLIGSTAVKEKVGSRRVDVILIAYFVRRRVYKLSAGFVL